MSVNPKAPRHRIPGVEFEGPLGFFWESEEVPIEALARAVANIFKEVQRRGWKEEFMDLVKNEMSGESEQ